MSKKEKQLSHPSPNAQPLTSGEYVSPALDHQAALERIADLRLELERTKAERGGLKESMEAAQRLVQTAHADLNILAKAARHGAPPEGFEPKTAEGKEALEQVVLLGDIAKEQRHRAEELQLSVDEAAKCLGKPVQNHYQLVEVAREAAETRKALRSDLMVLEQTAAGRAPDIALQTDIGKSAAHALSEVLTMLDKTNEQRLDGPALPLDGWASGTARQLVESVPPHERVLLLGDLLAKLLPHTGEHGQNETASDVLKRIMAEVDMLRGALTDAGKVVERYEQDRREASAKMVKVQSAMVARRAPDAEAGAVAERIAALLARVGFKIGPAAEALDVVGRIVAEWQGLRGFLSEAPLTAVAVRDDGHKGPVRERYSLLVLSWDGKAVQTRVVEGTRPWGDIRTYLEQTVRQNLIPVAYR